MLPRSLDEDRSTWPSRSVASITGVVASSLPLASLDFLLANWSVVTSPLTLAVWFFSFLSGGELTTLSAASVAGFLGLSSLGRAVSCVVLCAGSASLHCFRSLELLDEFPDISALVAEFCDTGGACLAVCVSIVSVVLLVSAVDDVLTTTVLGVGPKLPPVLDRLNALSSRCSDDTGIGTGTFLESSNATLSATVDVIGDCESAFPRLNDVHEIELGDEALGDLGEDECVLGGIRCTAGGWLETGE